MKNLLLFTWSYPYSVAAENTFIPQEITVLAKRFNKIVIAPKLLSGTKEDIPETNVSINKDYALFIKSRVNKIKFLGKAIFDKLLFNEIGSDPMFFLRNPGCVKKAFLYRLISIMTEVWIKKYFQSNKLSISTFIFETWWFDETTLGLANFSEKSKSTFTVTRAHGVDLYEERHFANYIPFRKIAIQKVQYVFPDSLTGSKYLSETYNLKGEKIQLGLLGVTDPGFDCRSSSDGIFRMLSCSFLIPLKRIDLLILGLQQLGMICHQKRFSWVHIGSGPEKEKLAKLAREKIPDNVSFQFIEYPGKKELYDFYSSKCVDLFINVSSTEGTPVAIIEAISCGVPVLATAVGGNKQIVDHENGILLDENPKPEDIAASISHLTDYQDQLKKLREGSKRRWFDSYNADINYNKFADIILNSDLWA